MALPSGELNPDYLIQDFRVGLWLVAIGFFLYFAKDFISRSKKAEIITQKRLFLGYAIFFTLYAITRVCFLIADYSTIHINGVLLPEYQFGREWSGGFMFELFWQVGTIIGIVGFTTLVFVIENYLLEKKTKLIFSIIGIGLIGFVSVMGLIARNLVYIAIPIMGVFPFCLYFYHSIISEGEMRQKAFLCGLALFLLLGGMGLDSKLMQNILLPLNIPAKIIGTILVIIGLFLFNEQYK